MEFRSLIQWIYGCIPLILTGIAFAYGGCPGDIPMAVSHCMTGFDAQVQMLGEPDTIFSGIDVESIRVMCSTYMSSMLCIAMMRKSCPAKQQEKIDSKIEHVLYLRDLCTRQNFYELYAMHQTCFSRLRSKSSECYTNFELNTNSIMKLAMTGNRPAIKECCRRLDVLLECVNKNVETGCGVGATSLVEDLVRPSVKIGLICKLEAITTTPPPPPTTKPRKPPEKPYSPRKKDRYKTIKGAGSRVVPSIDIVLVIGLLLARTVM
ncbi:uncharacterized protein LOC135491407 [Lineus longissimus]|uniref:uncharacterized protein LOC135491407 n=1 Tax=Lineus longissimus TaxID=88925 RepID=UPI002B4D8585